MGGLQQSREQLLLNELDRDGGQIVGVIAGTFGGGEGLDLLAGEVDGVELARSRAP